MMKNLKPNGHFSHYALVSLAGLGLFTVATVDARVLSPQSAIILRQTGASRSQEMVSAYLTVDASALDRDRLSELGVRVSLDLDDILTVRLPLDVVSDLANVPGVEYIQLASAARPMLDIARGEVGVDDVHAALGLDHAYTGAGVVVGIVDCGFDYNHAAFRDSQGKTRIRRVWEQQTAPYGQLSSPERYGYGAELVYAADIYNAAGDIRNNSHGTHVASAAAGSDAYLDGALRGMAPDADIVLVSMTEGGVSNVNISDAVGYIFDYADKAGLPCVVNLSLGSHDGPHDGTSTFDVIADRLQGPGRIIVGSAGNHRADSFHLRHEFDGEEATPLMTFVDSKSSSAKKLNGDIGLWADADAQFTVNLLAYKTTTAEVDERVQIYPSDEDAVTVGLGRNITGSFVAASEVSPLNGKVHLSIAAAVTNVRTGYAVALEVVPASASTIDIWTDNVNIGLSSHDMEGFSGPAGESSICEIGGTAKRILSVGAYTTRDVYTVLGDATPRTLDETVGDICSFSSCGPTADGRVKPQVTAPGCFISAAVSSYDSSGLIPYSQYHNGFGYDNYYGYMQGTSMSSPIVAGIVATWLQAWPQMSPEDLVDVISATSRTDGFTVSPYDWGYGKIDALAGVRECADRAASGGVSAPAADVPGYSDVVAYYDIYGRLVSRPVTGIYVAVTVLSDGSRISRKVMIR